MQYFKADFYDRYTALTKEQIQRKLSPRVRPVSVGPLWDGLRGSELRIRLDDGAVLLYRFKEDTLSLWENGRRCPDAPYAALKLQSVVLLSHMIPGSVRGYSVVIDTSTQLVTVFDMWFCGFEPDKREVWRTYRFGYVVGEGDAPVKRHTLSNRIEGTGLYWRDDDGMRSLVFYPSVVWSSFVELSNPRGGITKTAPSDYIRISDRMYIYSRVEQEYSGAMTLEVLDLYTLRHIGMRLGFDRSDKLVYRMFSGEGELTGRCTNLEMLTDYGKEIPYRPEHLVQMEKLGRGARPSYRPRFMHPDFTQSQVDEIVRTNTRLFQNASIMASRNTMETTEALAGLTLTLRYDDGPVLMYRFIDKTHLEWKEDGQRRWRRELYEATEPAENIYFFSHLCTGSSPLRCLTHALDLSEGLTTCVDAQLGNGRKPWEVGNAAFFGTVERRGGPMPPVTKRHGFTRDLLGKAFAWTYSDAMQSIHIYSTPESYSWTIMLPGNTGGWMWSSPCFYVKLREDVYLMSWTEDACNGNQGTFVLNTRIMHDSGFFFGIGGTAEEPDVHLHAFGAFARPLSGFQLDRFF